MQKLNGKEEIKTKTTTTPYSRGENPQNKSTFLNSSNNNDTIGRGFIFFFRKWSNSWQKNKNYATVLFLTKNMKANWLEIIQNWWKLQIYAGCIKPRIQIDFGTYYVLYPRRWKPAGRQTVGWKASYNTLCPRCSTEREMLREACRSFTMSCLEIY